MIHFDEYMFQVGWFNHQLDKVGPQPVMNRVLNPSKVIYNPSYLYIRPFIRVGTPFITGIILLSYMGIISEAIVSYMGFYEPTGN